MIPTLYVPWHTRWLKVIFPVQKHERKKVFLLLLLKFFISFIYCILTILKDTLLVTAEHSAAEVIPIVKGSIILPLSIAIVVLYTVLNNHFKPSTLFYGTVLLFLSLILIYGFVLYPNADRFSAHTMAKRLLVYTGGQHVHWVAVLRHWIHVLFFVVAELWGQVVLMVLYWSFVNSICTMREAKRWYPLLIAAGDVALVVTAPLILTYTKRYGSTDFILTVQVLLGYVVGAAFAILLTYWWANHTINRHLPVSNNPIKSKRLKLSLWESCKHVASSKYLANIAVMMVACGLSINILEGTSKAYLKDIFPQSADYQCFSSKLNFWTGISALVLSLFFSGSILRKFGWKATARITPILIGITGCIFFFMSYGKHHFPILSYWLGARLAWYIAMLGGIQSIIAKVAKYTFFDKTTQIAYIPLDPETKIKGKAAVDLLGSRLGKAGSSWVQIILLEHFHTTSIQSLSGILFVFLCITTIVWYRATNTIDRQLTLLEVQASDQSV